MNQQIVIQRRSRMVSFRVSEVEYERLKAVCGTEEVRSVSDLARLAIHRLIADAGVKPPEQGSFRMLCERFEELVREVGRVRSMMEENAGSTERR